MQCFISKHNNPKEIQEIKLEKYDHYIVPVEQWHQIKNPFKKPVHIIEIQYGDACSEEDIERI